MSVGGDKPFGLNDVKVTDIAGATQVDLPAARVFSFKPVFTTNELRGDDQVVSVASRMSKAEWELEAGGIDLDALAIITGWTVTESGSTPNQQEELQFDGGDCNPYFKVYGKALGDDCDDDIHVLLYKVKLLDMDGKLQDGEFFLTSCSGVAVDDGTNGVIKIIQHETATALPTT